MKDKIYYPDYDVFVDIETGEFLDMCSCHDCTFRQAWIADGSPEKLSKKILKELILEEGKKLLK